jgi:hypothetical protein
VHAARAITVVLLLTLLGIRIGGTLCVAICTPASMTGHHQSEPAPRDSSSGECHDSTSPGPVLSNVGGHDCLAHRGTLGDAMAGVPAGSSAAGTIAAQPSEIGSSPRELRSAPPTFVSNETRPPPPGSGPPSASFILRI